ncbi:holo-ACP synthase [Corticimicrobacter populi]|uniref:Holo-[acyl-carrier-protein] synthase n=1 Tax=Corticimicrobacter populi TaxID=2175229 RepID=A0A2V1K386_9BURK|nr:holo-ACP synthase [Corticimicrobacter populi]PWF22773.1 holo-ACP synthase [Corticimicrobacter populi]
MTELSPETSPISAPPALQVASGAIAGIGMDLLRIERIEAALARHGVRFASKILGPDELSVFEARSRRDARRGVRYLATRFCVKEAFSKAIGLGMRHPMWWTRVQTLNAPGGRPVLSLSGELRDWYAPRFGAMHVSITDESDLAAAYVIVETLRG